MKSKTNSKILLILGIILLSVFIFNMNNVSATNNISNEIVNSETTSKTTEEEIKKAIDVIPNTMNINIPEIEAKGEKLTELFTKEVEKIWKNNSINVEGVEKQLRIYATGIDEAYLYSRDEMFVGHIYKNNNNKELKTVKLICNNSDKYNAEDEKYVKNLKIEEKTYFEVDFFDFVKDRYSRKYTRHRQIQY